MKLSTRLLSLMLSLALAVSVCVQAMLVTAVAADVPLRQCDYTQASEDNILLGVKGVYITVDEEAKRTLLEQINRIRKEACDEGVPSPDNRNVPLTSADYVPIKWCDALEYAASLRAAEASVSIAHARLSKDTSIWNFNASIYNNSIFYSFGGQAEDIAWNQRGTQLSSMTYGINQWYGEKEDWLNGTDAVTGHYTSIINPKYQYIGLSAFKNPNAVYGWTSIVGRLSAKSNASENVLGLGGSVEQMLHVDKTRVKTLTLLGVGELNVGNSAELNLEAGISSTYNGYTSSASGKVYDGAAWSSSNTSVATVDGEGNVRALSAGKCVITATVGSLSSSTEITVKGTAQTPEIKSVTSVTTAANVTFTVVTTPSFNRVKASLLTNLSGYVKYSDKYTVNSDGDYVFTITVPKPSENTRYAFDGRRTDNSRYTKNYLYCDVEVGEAQSLIKSVSHTFSGSKLVFTVVTSAGDFSRIKAALSRNASGSLGVGTAYTVDKNGDYVWTVKVAVPLETTKYSFDLRDSSNKYLKNYFEYEVSMDSTIKYAKYTEYQGRLIFTVVTKAGDYNRLRCGLSTGTKDNLSNSNSYTVDANGDYVWVVKIQKPAEDTTLYFDLRDASTNKYIKQFLVYEFKA